MDLANGRWAQVDRDFFWPAKGFSWFALYSMGLARPDEVPARDFFLLRNLQRTGETTPEGYDLHGGEAPALNRPCDRDGPAPPAFARVQKNFRTARRS